MQFRVLGAVTVLVGGEPLRIPRRRERLLLAILLLARGTPVAADRLVDLLWGTEPPPQAKRSLHSHVARLRGLIKEAAGESAEVELVGSGVDYLVRLTDPDAVDATRFRSVLAQARGADDPAERVRLLRTALDLWQGDVLQDVASPEQRTELCGELEQLRTAATEDWAEAALALGRHGELIPELTALVARFPYRERFAEHLMVALDRAGRRHEALEAYTAMRTRLADELGIDPGPQLRQRHAEILRGTAPVAAPRVAPLAPPPNNHLPRQIPDFIGRADDIDAMCELLRGHDGELVCTVDGMAGVGKTTFTVHMAHRLADRYPDGQVFLDLHGHTPGHRPIEPSDALAALLRQCAVPANRIPGDLAGRAALWRTELAERRVLVVLDNAAGSAQVRHLLPGAAGGLTMITSRRRLTALDGAVPMTLATLSPAESVALFTKVAGAGLPATENRSGTALDDVVERCAHLPLAIRIAAARLRHRPTWSVAHLAARLADERTTLSELSDSDRSVAAAFTMSYRDLCPDQQRMYRLLGLLPLPMFDSHLAAALADLPLTTAENLIEDLVDAHVVEQAGVDRYQLHDLLRHHATAVGQAPEHAGERDPAIHRGLDYLLHTTLLATSSIDPYRRELGPPIANVPAAVPDFGDDGRAAIDWLESRCENVMCAIQFAHATGLDEHAWLLARAMVPLFFNRGYPTEWIASHRLALAAARRSGNSQGECVTLGNLSVVYRNVGRYEEAHEHALLGLSVATASDDRFGHVVAWCNVGLSHLQSGDHADAARSFRNALDVVATADAGELAENSWIQAEAIISDNLGVVYLRLGRLTEALDMSLHAIDLEQRIDDRRNECRSLHRLGRVHLRLDEVDDARECQQMALEMSREMGDLRQQARAIGALGMIDEHCGRLSSALTQLTVALRMQQVNQYKLDEATTLAGLGVVLDRLGRTDEAIDHHERALVLAEEIGAMDLYAEVRNNAGETRRQAGSLVESRDDHAAALTVAVDLDMRIEQARAYQGLSAVAGLNGDREKSLEYLRLSGSVTVESAPEPGGRSRTRSA